MRAPSNPKLDKSNDKMWFISWNHDVPHQLWHKYPRKRIRIKIYDNINRYQGIEREEYADIRLKVWQYNVTKNGYNPFAEEMAELSMVNHEIVEVEKEITEIHENLQNDTNILKALDLFIKSREFRTDNKNSISTWNGVVGWFKAWLIENQLTHLNVSDIKRKHVADALEYNKLKLDGNGKPIWGNRTYNNNLSNISTIFNFFVKEEMIPVNPFYGKIDKLKTTTSKNEWYNREIAAIVLPYVREAKPELYYAFAFTYFVAVRSQQELLKLKISDLDFSLNRIRFRKEVSKNGKEEFREWSNDFKYILDLMKLQTLPGDFYIFGSGGKPGPKKAGKNTLANFYRPIKDKLNIPSEYTIYSFKHTRVVHEMMKGTNPYEIQYLCRHQSLEETQHYMRGFDITLRNVYEPKDLTFCIDTSNNANN